jgi:small subunit ribosomal protein S1
MAQPLFNPDPREEMTRLAFGRVLSVDEKAGIITLELRSADPREVPVRATARLPGDGPHPQLGDIAEIVLAPGVHVHGRSANLPQRSILCSLDQAKSLVSFRRLFENAEPKREFDAVLSRKGDRSGWYVKINGCEAFASGKPPPIGDRQATAGDTIPVQVRHFDRHRGNFLVRWSSRLKRQAQNAASQGVSEGDIVQGRVAHIAEFGAFIEVSATRGNFTALLPNAEASWVPKARARDHLEIGTKRDFQVIKVAINEEGERRVTVSLRPLLPSPWDQYIPDLSPDAEIVGTVTEVTRYGAFVEVFPRLAGLLHRTQMLPVAKVGEALKRFSPGDQVRCRILRIDYERRRIDLAQGENS